MSARLASWRIFLTADVVTGDSLDKNEILCKVISKSGSEIPVENCIVHMIQGGYAAISCICPMHIYSYMGMHVATASYSYVVTYIL